jgi:hypothetical protein
LCRGTPIRPRGRLRCRAPPSPSRRDGIPPPKRKALCTVTEVTELPFRPKEHNSQNLVPIRQGPAVSATPLWRGRIFHSVRCSWSLRSPVVVLFSPVRCSCFGPMPSRVGRPMSPSVGPTKFVAPRDTVLHSGEDAVSYPAVPEPTRAVYRRSRETPFVPSLR